MPKTVVITGASSGIGRITAKLLAQRGMNVVLAARNKAELQKVAKECGASATLVQPTDVSNPNDISKLTEAAMARFGSIDVWINNAGVTQISKFIDANLAEFRQVIETNFFGTVYGSRAALNIFYDQGYGTLINVSSVLGAVADPYESAYVASKHAVRGFTSSLRQELLIDGKTEIHACTVMPATMDTPIYENAAANTAKAPQAIPPVYPADMTAEAISKLIDSPKNEVIVGAAGKMLIKTSALAPNAFEKSFASFIHNNHFSDEPTKQGSGALFEASKHAASHSGHPAVPRHSDAIAIGAVAALGAVAAFLIVKKVKS